MVVIEESPALQAFKELIDDSFALYLSISDKIGGLVKEQSLIVEKAVKEQFNFLCKTVIHKEPSQEILVNLLNPTSEHIKAIQSFREKHRATELFNHLSAVSESIPALGWVMVKPTPGPFVKDMTDSSQFYANKVLVAFKEKDKTQVEWAQSWIKFLLNLQKYIKLYHTTGLVWNVKGTQASICESGNAGPPPPPPPPPASLFADNGDKNRSALLKDLNKGSDITKNLKKITPDQQTHKNPNLRTQGSMPYKLPQQNKSVKAPVVTSKPPKFELEGRKWLVEYQTGQKQLTIKDTEMSQSVNIYKCNDSLIIVKGKVNSITVDSCVKVSLVFDDIVSVVEFINCQNVQAQSMGQVPTLNVEKTDIVEIYLNEKSLNAEIVTAKSSSVNVSVPDGKGDYVEHPIPEQFKSIWHGNCFKTEPADKAS